MSVISLAIYPGGDPNGTALVTLTDADVSSFEMRKAENELGAGTFTIRRDHPDATAANMADGNYVKVTIPQIDSDPIFGFWMDTKNDTILAATEEGGEFLTRGGPGSFAIVGRALLLQTIYSVAHAFRGDVSIAGYWTWNAQPYGAILVRMLEEGQLEPGLPLDDVTIHFNREHDSLIVNWPDINEQIQFDIGTDGLSVYERLVASGHLFVTCDPDLNVYGYGTRPGTNRSSGTFASGKVRFLKGTNIATELVRGGDAVRPATHALVRGKDLVYRQVVSPSYSSGTSRWMTVDYPESNDPDLLDAVGARALAHQASLQEAFEFEILPGDDQSAGLYLPGKHFDIGDTIRVHTGSGASDYNEANVPVVGYRIVLSDTSDDSTDALADLSLHIVVEAGGSTTNGQLGTGGAPARSALLEDPFFVADPASILTTPPDLTLRFRDLGTNRYEVIAASDGDTNNDAFMLIEKNGLLLNLFDTPNSEFSAVELQPSGVFIEGKQVVIESTGTANGSKVYLDSNVGVVIADLAADPDGAHSERAQIYYNTVSKRFRWYNGTIWQNVGDGQPGTDPNALMILEYNSNVVANTAIVFDTFYDRDQADTSLVIPANMGLTTADQQNFVATEDVLLQITTEALLAATPGHSGSIRCLAPDYLSAASIRVAASGNPVESFQVHKTVAMHPGDAFSFDALGTGSDVLATYMDVQVVRLA